jgi:hypothetical protein
LAPARLYNDQGDGGKLNEEKGNGETGSTPEFDPENLEQLSQADQIDFAFYPHEIFFPRQVTFMVRKEKYDFVETQSESADQKIVHVMKIINRAVMDEFLVHHTPHQFMHGFPGQVLMLENVSIHPEKIEGPHRRIESLFCQRLMEIFHDTTLEGT